MVRVLVVDDEPDLRFVLIRWFDRAGHDVSEAGDGTAALELVQRWRPDLVVTDLMMPVMDGFELIRRLRADPVTAGIPIIVLSGHWEVASGADAALAKPARQDELMTVAENLIKDGRDVR